MTVSKALVEAAIDNAEPEFEWCLKALAPLGGHGRAEEFAGVITSFQPRLLEAITGLESVYRKIKHEEKRLIAAKPRLNETWFRRRMAKLAFYRKALTQVLAIGRAIGDGFAWYFYEAHRELIDEHLKHQRQPLLPPRIGGLGEKLMLQHLPVIDGKLLLYHGITTFLRIGDFTLIDGRDLSIAAIGELKTSEAGEGRFQGQVALVSHDPATLPRLPSNTSNDPEPASELTPAMRQRRMKQIRVMHDALASAVREKEAPLKARLNEFYFDKLEEAILRATERRVEWIKAGDGLMIGAVRLPGRGSKKLSDIVLGRSKARVEHLVADAPVQAMKILNEDRRLNSLFIGSLCSDPLDFVAPKQSFPVALWPIAPRVLADLLLQRVMVITMFNPFPLWMGLERQGYELDFDDRGNVLKARKEENGRFSELMNFNHYFRMISSFLMTETSVETLMKQLIGSAQARFEGKSLKVELDARVNRFDGRKRGPSLSARKSFD